MSEERDPLDPDFPLDVERKTKSSAGLKFALVLGGCAGLMGLLVIAAFIAFYMLIETRRIPDSAAVPGHELREKDVEFLRSVDLLDPGEEIIYFYSAGTWSIKEDGNFFTDRRVVSYENIAPDQMDEAYQATYPEIASIVFNSTETFWEDSTLEITTLEDMTFYLIVSGEEGGDDLFRERLMREWKARRGWDDAERPSILGLFEPGEENRPVTGDELGAGGQEFLRSLGLLEPGEEILYFFSITPESIREDGNYFTDRRVVSYADIGPGQVDEAYWIPYPEIASIAQEPIEDSAGSWLVAVTDQDDWTIYLLTGEGDGGDDLFHERLMREWKARRGWDEEELRAQSSIFEGGRMKVAVPGEVVDTEKLDYLLELGLLEPGEEVLHFFSVAHRSIREGGNYFREDGSYFSNRRVVSYKNTGPGQVDEVYRATYPEIASIAYEPTEGFADDSIVKVTTLEGLDFYLIVSNGEGGDGVFYERLLAEWKARRGWNREEPPGKGFVGDSEPVPDSVRAGETSQDR